MAAKQRDRAPHDFATAPHGTTRDERADSRGSAEAGVFEALAGARHSGQAEFSLVRISAAGVVLDYQSSVDRVPARAPAEVIGAHINTVLPEEFATPILRGIRECLTSRTVVDVDYTLHLEDGGVRYRQARLAPSGVDEVVSIVSDNTNYRVTEARRRHLAEILEASTDYIATTDTSGNVLYANSAFRERFGAGPAEEGHADDSLFDFFSEQSREQFFRDGIPELWKTGRWSGEIEGIDANGEAVMLSQSAIAHRGPDGRAQYFSGIARDISETRATQVALIESHQRFHALVAHGNDPILVLTTDRVITYASPALERITGRPVAELIGTSALDLIHPDDLEPAIAGFLAGNGDSTGDGLQYRVQHRDGTWRWIESFTTNHLDTPGVNGLIVNARDITARKRANEQIEEASALLASVMGAAAHEAIFVTDGSGTIVAFSRGAEVLLGHRAQDVIGHLHPRAFHPEAQITETATALGVNADDLFRYSPPDGQSIVREWMFLRRDGSQFPGSLTVTPRFDSHGTLCGFLYVARDITEQRRVEAKLTERANHDALTGLGNRAQLQTMFEGTRAGSARTSHGRTLLFIDLDRFKAVNDTYGHATGDAVLRGTAQRLNKCLRAQDIAIRLGGDEFVVVLRPHVTEAAATRIAERIIEAIARPFPIDGNLICIGASIGLATSTKETSMDELLLYADQAAYAAKRAGRGQVVIASEHKTGTPALAPIRR